MDLNHTHQLPSPEHATDKANQIPQSGNLNAQRRVEKWLEPLDLFARVSPGVHCSCAVLRAAYCKLLQLYCFHLGVRSLGSFKGRMAGKAKQELTRFSFLSLSPTVLNDLALPCHAMPRTSLDRWAHLNIIFL